jgi:GNAT superfamily N-acetyltransferase
VDSACPVPFPLPSVNSNVSRQATAVIDLRQEPVADLREHAAIPSRFEAATVYDVSQSHSGFELVEREMSALYRKNYDDFEDPLTWPRTFDTGQWILFGAFAGAQRVGGAIVATATPGVDLLEGRSDLAVVWDLRVAPAYRRQSVAAALLDFAQSWARAHGCVEMKVETQNTNPAACKLYMHQGFALAQVTRGAYSELPDEVQLIWRRRLDG